MRYSKTFSKHLQHKRTYGSLGFPINKHNKIAVSDSDLEMYPNLCIEL